MPTFKWFVLLLHASQVFTFFLETITIVSHPPSLSAPISVITALYLELYYGSLRKRVKYVARLWEVFLRRYISQTLTLKEHRDYFSNHGYLSKQAKYKPPIGEIFRKRSLKRTIVTLLHHFSLTVGGGKDVQRFGSTSTSFTVVYLLVLNCESP